jgi:hypothetical protein
MNCDYARSRFQVCLLVICVCTEKSAVCPVDMQNLFSSFQFTVVVPFCDTFSYPYFISNVVIVHVSFFVSALCNSDICLSCVWLVLYSGMAKQILTDQNR